MMLRPALLIAATVLISLTASAAPAVPAARETVVTGDDIVMTLRHELADRLPAGPVQLDLDNPAIRLVAPAGDASGIGIDSLSYDERTGRVTAYISASAGATDSEPVRVTGRVYRMVDMPVLARPVNPGAPIAADDVQTIQVRSDRLNQSFVTSPADLVGKTPRRSLRPGELVRPSDVQTPILIHRNDLVFVTLQAPGITVTAQAKALADGTLGSAIRVANTRSGRTVEVSVTGPGTAAIVSPAVVP